MLHLRSVFLWAALLVLSAGGGAFANHQERPQLDDGASAGHDEAPPQNGGLIAVTGTGSATAAPDLVRVQFAVTREGADAAALMEELDAVVANVLALGRELAIAPADITAAAVEVYPRYGQGEERRMEGVTASRSIQVTLRDLSHYGRLVDGSLGTGINGVSGVQLDVSNREELEALALDLAIEAARAQAARVARGFEVTLDGVDRVDVDASAPPVPMAMRRMAMEASGGSFSAGEIEIERRVRAQYRVR